MSSDPHKNRAEYLQYSSAGIQMVLTILLFTFLGTRLDKYFDTDKPLWTAFLAIFGVVIALIFMLKAFTKKPEPPKNDQHNKEENKGE